MSGALLHLGLLLALAAILVWALAPLREPRYTLTDKGREEIGE